MVPVRMTRVLAPPDAQPSAAERALHDAARNGEACRARALLESSVGVDAHDERRRTPLMLAAQRGHVATMRTLMEAGAALDVRDAGKRRWPALMHALHADRATAALALLEWGADPDACEDSGYSALMMAASRGDRCVVDELLSRGADPMAELFLGFTALDYAIGYSHPALVRMLLDAAPQLRDRCNPARRTVLALADSADDKEILELLSAR